MLFREGSPFSSSVNVSVFAVEQSPRRVSTILEWKKEKKTTTVPHKSMAIFLPSSLFANENSFNARKTAVHYEIPRVSAYERDIRYAVPRAFSPRVATNAP